MDNLIKIIKEMGVIGAGGAGFPTHVKIDSKAQYILVNGAECEPLLRVDQQLMDTEAEKILFALDKCVEQVGAKQGIIGLKKKYYKAIASLEKIIDQYPKLSLYPLENVYPAGDEQFLVYELTGRIVPEAGIPIMVGVVVVNVETLLNISNAIDGIPVTHKYITVAGAVKHPMTMKVPVGISVRQAIDLVGGALVKDFKVIDGGPMMGKVLSSIDVPVKKMSKGYIVLPALHNLIKNKEKDVQKVLKETKTCCCHCNLCTEVCPRYLLGHKLHPSKLMRIASYGSLGDKNASIDEAFLCCECGLCEQACIMNLQPWKVNAFLKKKLIENGVNNSNKREIEEVNPFKKYRGFPVNKLLYKLEIETYDVEALIMNVNSQWNEVTLLSKEHVGAPSILQVRVGEYVKHGQLVFKADENALGANIHASIDGVVVEANQDKVIIIKK